MMDLMFGGRNPVRLALIELAMRGLLALLLTYFSLAIADHAGTPQFVRYVFYPARVRGMHFRSGAGFLEVLGSFGRIALTVNAVYYGLISFFLIRETNWPKLSRNPRCHFWLEPSRLFHFDL
jgi:hypothetical protein